MPKKVEEKFLNLSTGLEELLIRVENEYTKEGWPIRQNVYDRNGNFCYCIQKSYNSWGKVLQEIDPLGQVTSYRYDNNGNVIFKQTPNPDFHTLYTYDFSNRLIREEEVYNTGNRLVKSYAYDYMGHKVASTDYCGNTTHFCYDEFGRLREKINPAIHDGKTGLYQPIDKVSYDLFNNPFEKTDSNHFITRSRYTHQGKPYCIEHPDGCEERSIYNSDGTLRTTIDANWTVTHFSYDYNNRKIKEEIYSRHNQLLSTHTWNYNAFHLLSEIDAAGREKIYTYDHAGRLIAVKYGDSEVRYGYDPLNRQAEVWEQYEPGKYRKTVIEYDNLNRIVQQRIEDESGTVFSFQSFGYDCDGNKTQIIIHTSQEHSCTKTFFNNHKKPTKIIKPDGSETRYQYSYDYKNDFGQTVYSESEIDGNGNTTIRVMDACGRLSKEERKDALGKLVKRTHFNHDGEGNLIQRKEDVIVAGECRNTILTEFRYDPRNRQIAVIEASGDALQKTTRNEYRITGELLNIIKPDGVVLMHAYNDLGQLIEMRSSDNTVHYVYHPDLSDRVVRVDDLVLHTMTLRTFDRNDRLIAEKMANGLQYGYSYDHLGRLKEIKMPDQTTLTYGYDAAHLKTVTRGKNGKSYSQHYGYDLSGKLTSMEMPNGLGTVVYTYDRCLRPKQIESPFWSQQIPEDGFDPCGNLLQINQTDVAGKVSSQFGYDALHQLVSETGCAQNEYGFDSVQNRIRKNQIPYNLNALNQLKSQSGSEYDYDPNGNLCNRRNFNGQISYRYDALDRLVGIETPQMRIEYRYDAFHRRTDKTVHTGQGVTETRMYGYQADIEIGAYDAAGNPVELRLIGHGGKGGIGAAAFVEMEGRIFVPLHDYRGNVSCLLDVESRAIRESYRYSAYGEEQLFDGSGQALSQSINPWRFSSKRYDLETGWLYFGRRYYDPEIGRWTTPDPLGFVDGTNLYCYVQNRPLIYVDPDGELFEYLFAKENHRCESFFSNNYETCVNSLIRKFCGDDVDPYEYSRRFTIEGKKSDHFTITFINGMRNSFTDSEKSAKLFSTYSGGCEVRAIYNATFGIVFDNIAAGVEMFGRIATDPTRLLLDLWYDVFANMPSDGIIIHGCHSKEAIHTGHALEFMPDELRKRIFVIAVAPAEHIPREICGDVLHLESRDIVHSLEWILGGPIYTMIYSGSGAIMKLTSHPNAEFIDHSFDSPTYEDNIHDAIDFFKRRSEAFP